MVPNVYYHLVQIFTTIRLFQQKLTSKAQKLKLLSHAHPVIEVAEQSGLIVCPDQVELLAVLLNTSNKIGLSSPVLVLDSAKPLNTNVRQQLYHLNTTSGVLKEVYMLKSVEVTNVVAEYKAGSFSKVQNARGFLQRRSNFSGMVLDFVSVEQTPHLIITNYDEDHNQGCLLDCSFD